MEEDNKEVIVDGTSVDTTNPTENLEENEEVVGTLEDTSEADASQAEEEKESVKEKLYTQKELQEAIDRNVKGRLARAENEYAKKIQEYEDLAYTLRKGMGKNDGDVNDLNKDLRSFYKEQGIDIPEPKIHYNERDERILAKADAEEIIEAGEDEVNRIANQIYNKPEAQRTIREKVIFETLGKHVIAERAKAQLKEKGVNEDILSDDKFKKFASQFNTSTPITEIYNLYDKLNKTTEKKTPPPSTGSVKTTGKSQEIKDYYTPEEVSKFTMEQLKSNPRLMKAVDNSMAKWNK